MKNLTKKTTANVDYITQLVIKKAEKFTGQNFRENGQYVESEDNNFSINVGDYYHEFIEHLAISKEDFNEHINQILKEQKPWTNLEKSFYDWDNWDYDDEDLKEIEKTQYFINHPLIQAYLLIFGYEKPQVHNIYKVVVWDNQEKVLKAFYPSELFEQFGNHFKLRLDNNPDDLEAKIGNLAIEQLKILFTQLGV